MLKAISGQIVSEKNFFLPDILQVKTKQLSNTRQQAVNHRATAGIQEWFWK